MKMNSDTMFDKLNETNGDYIKPEDTRSLIATEVEKHLSDLTKKYESLLEQVNKLQVGSPEGTPEGPPEGTPEGTPEGKAGDEA